MFVGRTFSPAIGVAQSASATSSQTFGTGGLEGRAPSAAKKTQGPNRRDVIRRTGPRRTRSPPSSRSVLTRSQTPRFFKDVVYRLGLLVRWCVESRGGEI